jgi:hypothetical protein
VLYPRVSCKLNAKTIIMALLGMAPVANALDLKAMGLTVPVARVPVAGALAASTAGCMTRRR